MRTTPPDQPRPGGVVRHSPCGEGAGGSLARLQLVTRESPWAGRWLFPIGQLNHPGADVDDEACVGDPSPGRHVGQGGHPQATRRSCGEVRVDQVPVPLSRSRRTWWCRPVWSGARSRSARRASLGALVPAHISASPAGGLRSLGATMVCPSPAAAARDGRRVVIGRVSAPISPRILGSSWPRAMDTRTPLASVGRPVPAVAAHERPQEARWRPDVGAATPATTSSCSFGWK